MELVAMAMAGVNEQLLQQHVCTVPHGQMQNETQAQTSAPDCKETDGNKVNLLHETTTEI